MQIVQLLIGSFIFFILFKLAGVVLRLYLDKKSRDGQNSMNSCDVQQNPIKNCDDPNAKS